MTFYEHLKKDKTYQDQLTPQDKQFIKAIEKTLNFSKFRYYQKEALNIFDFFYNQNDTFYFKKQLKEDEIYYYGFEMATGSGKTFLIAATIAYLKSKGIKNFLILTPNTTIYHKTIKNFDVNSNKSIFNSNLNFKFNLITGEDYTGRSNSFDAQIETNIFVFNIQKFFDRVKGEKGNSALKIKKAWEQGALKDDGNAISLHEFLVNKELAIITDEAHHYQQKKSSEVIKDLKPSCVLEFTATAVEEEVWRRKQKIIYKYPIDRYINDGFGKKIRAFGHSTPELQKVDKKDVSLADKEKIIISILIHYLKKKALNGLKPILLIRAREQTEHADKVKKFITEELPYKDSLIESVFEQLKIDEKYDIIHLIRKHIPTVKEFKEYLLKLKDNVITYHINSTTEENELFENIEDNDIEVVVQLKRAEEGWNVDTVYTILILNYGVSEIRTYVKQLIGRGLRLPKEKRENFKEPLPEQTEILHVVCEKGNNFSEFIEQIRKDLELTGESLEEEYHSEEQLNEQSDSEISKYADITLPVIFFDSKLKFSATEILKNISYSNLKLDSFIRKYTEIFQNEKIIVFKEDELNIEESILKEDKSLVAKEREHKIDVSLVITESDFIPVIDQLIYNHPILPSLPATKEVFIKILLEINKQNLKYQTRYKNIHEEKQIKRKLLSKLYKHLSEQIDSMFSQEAKISKKQIKEIFKEYHIEKKINPDTGEILNQLNHSLNVPKRDIKKFLFNGYNKSFYKFNWFESSHEKDFAETIDKCEDIEFWVRNTRQYYLEHGVKKRYYPDFIVKTKNSLFIVEIKGEGFYEVSKENILLLRSIDEDKDAEVSCILLLDKTMDSKITNKVEKFKQIIDYNELHLDFNHDKNNQNTLI